MRFIQNHEAALSRLLSSVVSKDDCWFLRQKPNKEGYAILTIEGKQWFAHRLMHFLTTGEQPEVVMHICDTPRCCNPQHLSSGTHQTNQADKVVKGRQASGNKINTSKIPDSEVSNILNMLETMTQQAVADVYGVHQSTISNIYLGKRKAAK